jgi:hypothetical protein
LCYLTTLPLSALGPASKACHFAAAAAAAAAARLQRRRRRRRPSAFRVKNQLKEQPDARIETARIFTCTCVCVWSFNNNIARTQTKTPKQPASRQMANKHLQRE